MPDSPTRQRRRAPVTSHHWLVLTLCCLVVFGNYYCYDLPSALNVPLRKHLGTDYTTYQYQLNVLYSVYSLPNIVMPLIGGVLADRWSSTQTLVLFALLVSVGQILFAVGVTVKSFGLMVFGRFLFGLGGESLEVAAASVTTVWFRRRGLAFALALNLASARLATAANDNLSPWIARYGTGLMASRGSSIAGDANTDGTPLAMWFGVIVTVVSVVNALILFVLDTPSARRAAGIKRDGREITERETTDTSSQRHQLPASLSSDHADATRPPQPSQDQHTSTVDHPPVQQENIDASTTTPPPQQPNTTIEEYDAEDETVHVTQIHQFKLPFWLLFMMTVFVYGSVIPFFHICTDFFEQKWYGGDTQMAGTVMSIPDVISAVGSPVCGMVLDRMGHRSTFMPISGLFIVISHVMMWVTMWSPGVAMSVMGVGYTMFASAIWPCVPFLVGSHQIATAYGLLTVALNSALFVFPMVVAVLRHGVTDPADFSRVQAFFVVLGVMGMCVCLVLWWVDYKYMDGILMKPSGVGGEDDAVAGDHTTQIPGVAVTTDGADAQSASTLASSIDSRTRLVDNGNLDDDGDEDDSEDSLTAKVVGNGLAIVAPTTWIHHHHVIRSPDIASARSLGVMDSRRTAAGSPSTSWLAMFGSSVSPRLGPSQRHMNATITSTPTSSTHESVHYHTTFCKCYEDNGGLMGSGHRQRHHGQSGLLKLGQVRGMARSPLRSPVPRFRVLPSPAAVPSFSLPPPASTPRHKE